MTDKKPRGSLRDFRIDRSLTPELSTPRDLPQASLLGKKEIISKVTPRSSAMEWTREDELLSSAGSPREAPSRLTESVGVEESLWGEWKDDLELPENEIAKPLASSKPGPAHRASNSLKKDSQPPKVTLDPILADTESRTAESSYSPVDSSEKIKEGHAAAETFTTPSWVEELALAERRAERTGVVDFTNSYQKQELLKQLTREFTSELSKAFRESVEKFNHLRKAPAHAIQFYRVSKTADDFMIFRNGVKLIVSGARAGRVLFAFNQYMGQIFAPTQSASIEIEADWGPFDQLFWSYKGERVRIEEIVRYFMTEFTRQSFK